MASEAVGLVFAAAVVVALVVAAVEVGSYFYCSAEISGAFGLVFAAVVAFVDYSVAWDGFSYYVVEVSFVAVASADFVALVCCSFCRQMVSRRSGLIGYFGCWTAWPKMLKIAYFSLLNNIS